MPAFVYQLTLLSDASFSASSSTTQSESLDYIPGAALLGAVASRAYPADADAAWRHFHSGALRFGPALPVLDGQMAVPTPKCLYRTKGGPPGQPLVNAVRKPPVGQQAQFSGSGYLSPKGATASLSRRSSLRTKVDPETGRADEGRLYALEALPAGSQFIGQVSADTPELLTFARANLAATLALGRSRGTELGQAAFEILSVSWLPSGTPRRDEATFLCLADVALSTLDGQPRLVPDGADVGLDGWAFDAGASALRTRSYSPYNTHRRRSDVSRQVIAAGSVLVFKGNGLPNAATVALHTATGVGEHRAEGLGSLWFEPEPLQAPEVGAWQSVAARARPLRSGTFDSPLLTWLEDRDRAAKARDALFGKARAAGARLRSIPRAQWGELSSKVGANGDLEAIELFLKVGVRQHSWKFEIETLLGELRDITPGDRSAFLALLAQHARHASKGREE